jgi:hypothetical protein
MRARLRVELPADRLKTGKIALLTPNTLALGAQPDFPWKQIFGPLQCYGKADNEQAIAAGNPNRDPLHTDGDFPLGEYTCRLAIPTAAEIEDAVFLREYGPYGYIELTPVSGDALTAAKNGRAGLRVHSGASNAFGGLRPTHGCLRVSNADFNALRAAIESLGTLELLDLVADEMPEIPLPLAS